MSNQLITKRVTEGDRLIAIADTLVDANGVVIDLTGKTVAFHLIKGSDNSVLIDQAGVVDAPPTAGNVSYPWTTAPPAVPSGTELECYYWWIVTDSGSGKTARFPHDGKLLRLIIMKAF